MTVPKAALMQSTAGERGAAPPWFIFVQVCNWWKWGGGSQECRSLDISVHVEEEDEKVAHMALHVFAACHWSCAVTEAAITMWTIAWKSGIKTFSSFSENSIHCTGLLSILDSDLNTC